MRSYRIRVGIVGYPAAGLRAAVPDIRDELEQRMYLRHPYVAWDEDLRRIILEVEDDLDDGTFEQTELNLNDDLSDIVSACVVDWDFQVLDVSPTLRNLTTLRRCRQSTQAVGLSMRGLAS